jgi:predicted HTH transcriptional regulator
MLEKINTIASRNGRMEFQRGIVYNKESFGIHAETIYPWDKIDIKNIVEIGLFSPRQKQEMALWHFLTSTKLTQKEISNKIGLSQSTISQSIAYTKKNGNIKSF